jgi:hypothetical protein
MDISQYETTRDKTSTERVLQAHHVQIEKVIDPTYDFDFNHTSV